MVALLRKKSAAGKLALFACAVLTACALVGCGTLRYPPRIPSTLTILDDLEAQERIMLVFAKAYPEKISDVAFIDNDWTMLVNGVRFFFANGRFLPEELRGRWAEFHPYDFYVYPWIGTPRERRAMIRNPVFSIGSSFLFDTLYDSPEEDASLEQQVKYYFFDVKLLVNRHIEPLLDRVQERIRIAAKTDLCVKEWLSDLRGYGWYWRNIAGTYRRSLHSYGIAIDLLPIDLRGRQSYWRWDTSRRINIDNYYMPPEAVVMAFEAYGFIWGGNWSLIDTMHFEYRPEILLLNNFVIEHLSR